MVIMICCTALKYYLILELSNSHIWRNAENNFKNCKDHANIVTGLVNAYIKVFYHLSLQSDTKAISNKWP